MSDKIKKILFVVPSLARAGAEMQLVDLINGLVATGIEAHLVVMAKPYDVADRLSSNVEVHRLEKRGFVNGSAVALIRRLQQDHQFDWIHCTLQYALLHVRLAMIGLKNKPKCMAVIHTTINLSNKEELFDRCIYIPILKQCESVIFVCNAQRKYWLKRSPSLENISEVVHNGVDTDHFMPDITKCEADSLRKNLNIPKGIFIIGSIAGFRPEKNHLTMLDALAKVENIHLVLAGDGPMRGAIEEKIADLGLQERVHLLGRIVDVRALLDLVDVSVLPSIAVETFSIAMLESLAMKTPVIGADIGGMEEAVIDGKTGWLLGEVTEKSLSSAFVTARETLKYEEMDPRCLVNEMYSLELMINKYAAIL